MCETIFLLCSFHYKEEKEVEGANYLLPGPRISTFLDVVVGFLCRCTRLSYMRRGVFVSFRSFRTLYWGKKIIKENSKCQFYHEDMLLCLIPFAITKDTSSRQSDNRDVKHKSNQLGGRSRYQSH